jgi:hypothetical protein
MAKPEPNEDRFRKSKELVMKKNSPRYVSMSLIVTLGVLFTTNCSDEDVDEMKTDVTDDVVQTRNAVASEAVDDRGFTVFYADKNMTGFAAHAYENESCPDLGSLDKKDSSLVSYTDYVTCVYDQKRFGKGRLDQVIDTWATSGRQTRHYSKPWTSAMTMRTTASKSTMLSCWSINGMRKIWIRTGRL